MGVLRATERLCLVLGVLGLAVVGWAYADSRLGARHAVAMLKAADSPANASAVIPGAPLALLSIGRLDMEVPVFYGTDQRTLNRGAGLVEGTSRPGESGNVVVSAHRDSFFRPLERIAEGDEIELMTDGRAQVYRVVETFVTDPLDVSVLEPTSQDRLTLVTCYPFRYVGFAPERFIVLAVAQGDPKLTLSQSTSINTKGHSND